ncbi:MAG: septal ring lytic transglycosylase RlpA family protein [Synechococcus sp.]
MGSLFSLAALAGLASTTPLPAFDAVGARPRGGHTERVQAVVFHASEHTTVAPLVAQLQLSAPPPPQPTVIAVSTGEASWYGPGFYGNRTANGEVYRPGTMTAAHRTLPFGTKVRVTNLSNGRTAVIRINDRGPFVAHRVIDLGHGAATRLGLLGAGIAQVRLEVLR